MARSSGLKQAMRVLEKGRTPESGFIVFESPTFEPPLLAATHVRRLSGGISFRLASFSELTDAQKKSAQRLPLPLMLSD